MSNEDIARLLEAIKDWNGIARDEFASQIDDAVKSLRRPTMRAADGSKWRCKSCGFSSGVEYSVCIKCKSPRR